jgi:hypothetical protein
MVCLVVFGLVFILGTSADNIKNKCNETNPVQTENTQTEPDIVSTDVTIQTESYTETESSIPETEPQYTETDVWAERYAECPVATEVWLAMKEFGWSDVVCAGIMGNLMRETGGDTLHLRPTANSSSGFGLVQWTGQRKKDMCNKYGHSPTIAEQMEFMKDELFGSNGVRKQVTDQQRERIFEADTPEKCAAEFARWFERPASKNYSRREANAKKAYNYFQ